MPTTTWPSIAEDLTSVGLAHIQLPFVDRSLGEGGIRRELSWAGLSVTSATTVVIFDGRPLPTADSTFARILIASLEGTAVRAWANITQFVLCCLLMYYANGGRPV